MSKIVEFKMAKGITIDEEGQTWRKKRLELTVQMPEKHTDEQVQVDLTRAEYIIDTFLGQPEVAGAAEVAQIPDFNPEDLMKHPWKGKKDPDREGEYKKGSVAWGWDFKKEFPEKVLKVLEKGPMVIGEYVFAAEERIVTARKKKDSARK